MNHLYGVLLDSLDMFRLMAPYLILGLLAAGLLHAPVPRRWVARHLGRRGVVGSVKAALVGGLSRYALAVSYPSPSS